MRLGPAMSRKFGAFTLAGSMQVLNETETLVPAKTPVASVGGSTLTTDSWVAGGSVHCPPVGARFEPHAASAPATRTVPARPRGSMFITLLRNGGSRRGYETRRVWCKGEGVSAAGCWCARSWRLVDWHRRGARSLT